MFAGAVFQTDAIAGNVEDFYTQKGTDPSFEEVMKSGKLPRGRNSGNGFEGSKIKVNHDLLKDFPSPSPSVIQDINIHTLGNSVIRRTDFDKWSRWYQEDANTQIFRLFKDEENVRNSRGLAARIEAFSSFGWKKGDGWQEWAATYTIIKPHRCAIFQAKNPLSDWSVMINMNDDGDVFINHRRADNKVIARNMVGKPFHIRIRENGHDYEGYFNGKLEGSGSYDRPKGETGFRWGMYLGAKPVTHDAMILVTGAVINPKDSGEQLVAEPKPEPQSEPEPEPEPGIPIPLRTWKNRNGESIRAEARFEAGSDVIKLKVRGKWIPYPLEELSDTDRKELAKAMEALPD
jgi:hypothetical protein